MKKSHFLCMFTLVITLLLSYASRAYSTGEYSFKIKPYDFDTKQDVTINSERIGVLLFLTNNTDFSVDFDQVSTLDSSVNIIDLNGSSLTLTHAGPTSGLVTVAPYSTSFQNLDIITLTNTAAPLPPGNYILSMAVEMEADGVPLLMQFSDFIDVDASHGVNWDTLRVITNEVVNWPNVRDMSRAGIDWNEIRDLSGEDVNWPDVENLSTSGVNWRGLAEFISTANTW